MKNFIKVLLFALFINFTFSAVEASAENVELYYAESLGTTFDSSGNGVMTGSIKFYIQVENLSYDKYVAVHYDFNNSWQDASASFFKSASNNKEIWAVTLTLSKASDGRSGFTIPFALKYTVNGQTYWDNNNSNNYYISCGPRQNYAQTLVGAIKVLDYGSQLYTDSNSGNLIFNGSVLVKEYDLITGVRITYTTDNWNTINTVDASFYADYLDYIFGGDKISEVWNYQVIVPSNTTNIKYAIEAIYNNYSIWDNNFNSNYEITQ